MIKSQLPGVEHLPRVVAGAASGVNTIAENGVAEMLEMDADLMGPAAVQSAFDQAGFGAALPHAIIGPGGPASFVDRHPLAVDAVTCDAGLNDSSGEFGFARDQSQIDFFHRAVGKLTRQMPMGHVILGHDQTSARLLVEAVDNSRPFRSANAGEIAAVGQERIHQSAAGPAGAGMNGDTRGLIEHEQVLIFVENRERDCFR